MHPDETASAPPPATPAASLLVGHATLLGSGPSFESPPCALVWAETAVCPGRSVQGFLEVSCPDGQRGFLPAALCAPAAAVPAVPIVLIQPTWLHSHPVIGMRYGSPGERMLESLVMPEEPLLQLGTDQQFVLVQRGNGQIGYLPRLLCAMPAPSPLPGHLSSANERGASPHAPHPAAPPLHERLICLLLGLVLIMVNGQLLLLLRFYAPDIPIDGFVVLLGLCGGLVPVLWLCSPRPALARPFALGILVGLLVLLVEQACLPR